MKRIWSRSLVIAATLALSVSLPHQAKVSAATNNHETTLTLGNSGPEVATIHSEVSYHLVVRNTGNAIAKKVFLRNLVPDGFTGQPVTLNLDHLAPGHSQTAKVTFKTAKRGKLCNTATVVAGNAAEVSADACTTVLQPDLKVEKSGTTEEIVGREAIYEVIVSNTGDTILENVVVTDTAPSGIAIVSAPGAAISGNKATWTIPSLPVGAKKGFTAKQTSKTTGNLCNQVTASAGSLRDSAQACTVWKSSAAVLLAVVDDPDSVQIGKTTTYTIKVINEGLTDIRDVRVIAMFDDKIVPTASAHGHINGLNVNFARVPLLAPKETLTYVVTVKGTKAGDSHNKVTLTCDELPVPVEETENTTVY